MSYADKIKAKIKEIDLETQLSGLVDEGGKVVNDSVMKAGDVAYDKRDDVAGWLDKASGKVNEKTDEKYADQLTKVRDAVLSGVDKLAGKRRWTDPVAEIEQAKTDQPDVGLSDESGGTGA